MQDARVPWIHGFCGCKGCDWKICESSQPCTSNRISIKCRNPRGRLTRLRNLSSSACLRLNVKPLKSDGCLFTGCLGFWCLPILYGKNVQKTRGEGSCIPPCLLYTFCPLITCCFAGMHR